MECDGDPQSILSLPQHALLQSENAVSSSLSSTAKSPAQPSDKSQQQWLQGAYTDGNMPSTSSTSSLYSNNANLPTGSSPSFTQSLSLTQGGSNSNPHSHQLITNSSNSKYYGHADISNVVSQEVPYNSNRTEQRFSISPTSFSAEGGANNRSSNSNIPSISANFELNSATQPGNTNSDDNNNANADNNSDGNGIGQYYYYQAQAPYRNSSSSNFYCSRGLVDNENGSDFVHNTNRGSHRFDPGQSQTTSQAILGVTNYQHCSSTEVDGAGDKITKSHSSSRHQSHPNVEDMIAFSQSGFDPRSKLLSSSKDQTDAYDGGQCVKTGAALGHEILPSVEKRQQEMNLVTEFDFSLSARDFGPAGSSCGTRMDYIPHSRQSSEDFRLNQDQSSDFLTQDLSHQRYTTSSSHSQPCSATVSATVSARKISSMHSDFSINQSADQNIYTSSSKSAIENHGSTFPHKDLVSALKPSDSRHARDYKKVHFHKEESQQQAINENSGHTVDQQWSGRSRAHRKMARLLGQGLSCKDKPEKTQDNAICTSSSSTSYQGFPKKLQDMTGYGSGFQEMHKTHETSSKNYSLSESNNRDPPSSSSLHSGKHVDRSVNATEKSTLYDRREDDTISRGLNSIRDYNVFVSHNVSSSSSSLALIPKDTNTSLAPPSHQQFFSANAPSLDLEFQQSLAHRDLELNPQFVLQVSKDLGMEESLTDNVNVNPELFSHHVDPHQISQTNFPFTDNLNTQELSLESYLIPPDKDSSTLSKKMPYYNQRNLATSETEFNIEEYMEGQGDKDFTQAYFDRTDNVPQDMTMYQKVSPEKSTSSNYTKFREREFTNSQNFKAVTMKHGESSNISELQKELTKSSGKESMKGVRIPRDIHRAMEILQDLQETEKEEEKRKRELEKQNTEIQNAQNVQLQSQQQQPPQPKFQQSATNINSSPKKTFQNKHQIESMAAMTEQQLLSMQTNFIEDQTVENVNFLDQPGYCFPDQPPVAQAGFCDPSMQEISQYSGFPSLYPSSAADLEAAAPSSNKPRDYQQQNTGYPLNQDVDYHVLKRIAFSAANVKDLDTSNMSASLQQHGANVTPWMSGNPSVQSTDASDLNFNLGIRLPEPINLLNEGAPPPPSSSKFTPNSSDIEEIRGGQIQSHCENLNYPEVIADQRGVPCLDSDKFSNFATSSFGDISANNVALPGMDIGLDKTMALDILEKSRQNLYTMMKQEQLCDAVLSTSNVEVKVHQAILCSMSQYLSSRLLPPSQQSIESKSTTPSSSSTYPQSSKIKDGSYFGKAADNQYQHHLVMLVINCDNIKSSSISAFLMFIYLGKTEFNESNVLDLLVLASTLHVSTLKSLCLQFMWQTHISSDGLTIPSVQISKKGVPEMRDQECYANLGKKHQTEDKAVYTCRVTENTDVASQTDQTTSKVGRGGQDEWVMLKKTKQKTVSPSKSKINLNVKGIATQDNNPQLFKPSKKSWLSPKRRFKSELLAQSKNDANNLTKIKDKDVSGYSDSQKDVSVENEDALKEINETTSHFVTPDRNVSIGKRPRMILPLEKGVSTESGEFTTGIQNARHIKTTVEIAEEAAAAKLSASIISKSFKKGDFLSLGTGHNKLNQSATTDSQMDGNSIVYSQPEITLGSHNGKIMQNNSNKKDVGNQEDFYDGKMSTRRSTLTIEKPVKKKIIQETLIDCNSDVNAPTMLETPINSNLKKMEMYNSNRSLCTEKHSADGIAINPNCASGFPSVSEGDLNHVSYFIDSIVNKMGSETEDAELQKVIHDLDSELNRPQISASVIATSCPVSTLSSSPTLSFPLPCTTATTSMITPISTTSITPPPSSSSSSVCPKSKSANQGFRKRLIQLVKSENLKQSSFSPSSTPPETSSNPLQTVTSSSQKGMPSENPAVLTGSESLMSTPHCEENTRSQELTRSEEGFLRNQNEYKNGTEDDTNNSASEKGKGNGPADDYDTQFHHKIFKRKRKSKHRKALISEPDNQTPCLKSKIKKTSSGSEMEGTLTKTRVRRNASATVMTSDSETSVVSIGTRSKGKKAAVTESSEMGGVIRNVRPPPKKRAKMERELLKVTTDNDLNAGHRNGKDVMGDERNNAKDDKGKLKPSAKSDDNDGNKERNMPAVIEGENSMTNNKDNEVDADKTKQSVVATNIMETSENIAATENKAPSVIKSKLNVKSTQKRKCPDVKSTEASTSKKLPKPKEGNIATTLNIPSKNDSKEKTLKQTSSAAKKKSTISNETSPASKGTTSITKEKSTTSKESSLAKASPSKQTKSVTKEKATLRKTSLETTELSSTSNGTSITLKEEASSPAKEKSTPHSSLDPNSAESQCVVQLQKQFEQSGLKTKIFSCKLCKSHLKSALVSVRHVMTIHKLKGDEILQNVMVGLAENQHEACDICGYVTKDVTYKYMHYHKYFKHSVPLPAGLVIHKCDLCSREFQTSYQLNEHVRGHDDDFSFTCWVCGQSFKSRNNMNNHVFHKHSEQRKHSCKICDKAFKTWTQLKIHCRIHTGDRPFQCPYCDYGSTTLGNMRHHLSHKHRMEKDAVEQDMAKISERKTDMTPDSLDQLLDLIVSKVIPDKAKPLTQERNGKNKNKKKIRVDNNDKSSGEENFKSKASKDKTTYLALHDSTKAALKEKVYGNCIKISSPTCLAESDKNGKHKLLLPKIQVVNSNKKSIGLSRLKSSGEKQKDSSPLSCHPNLPTPYHLQQQQGSTITIISHPTLANSNIVFMPPGMTGMQPVANVAGPSSHVNNSTAINGSTASPNDESNPISSSKLRTLLDQSQKSQGSSEKPNKNQKPNFTVDSSTSFTSNSQADEDKTAMDSNATLGTMSGTTDPQMVSHTAISVSASPKVPNSQNEKQSDSTNTLIDKIPVDASTTASTSTALQPIPCTSSPMSSSTVPSLLPAQPLQLQQYIQCDGSGSGQTSNFVYGACPPILLQNPVSTVNVSGSNGDTGGGGLTMYPGFLPSFIMYPCQSDSSNANQQTFLQIQNTSGLMQIVPMAAAQGTVIPSSLDIPMFQEPANATTTIVNALPNVTVVPTDNNNSG